MKTIRRLCISIIFPLFAFYWYWQVFDEKNSDVDLLRGAVISMVLAITIFLYLPTGKKIERFSIAWGLGLILTLFLASMGLIMSGFIGSAEFIPIETKAWGEYIFFFAIWMPVIHELASSWDKPYKWSFFKRPTPIEDAESTQA